MKEDPIVTDVRAVRDKIWRECERDRERLLARLKKWEDRFAEKVVKRAYAAGKRG